MRECNEKQESMSPCRGLFRRAWSDPREKSPHSFPDARVNFDVFLCMKETEVGGGGVPNVHLYGHHAGQKWSTTHF